MCAAVMVVCEGLGEMIMVGGSIFCVSGVWGLEASTGTYNIVYMKEDPESQETSFPILVAAASLSLCGHTRTQTNT